MAHCRNRKFISSTYPEISIPIHLGGTARGGIKNPTPIAKLSRFFFFFFLFISIFQSRPPDAGRAGWYMTVVYGIRVG